MTPVATPHQRIVALVETRMLVTVSGMVGSGKSTAVRSIARLLEQHGVEATCWNFQSLPCFGRRRLPRPKGVEGDATQRWTEYRQKPLTARLTTGYLVRILAFRVFRRWHGGRHCHVMNRYFYDNLVHYRLTTRREQRYVALLQRLVPVPDVAILLVASAATIETRRPAYSATYVTTVEEAYDNLRRFFPQLVVVNTDRGQASDRIDPLILERIVRAADPGP